MQAWWDLPRLAFLAVEPATFAVVARRAAVAIPGPAPRATGSCRSSHRRSSSRTPVIAAPVIAAPCVAIVAAVGSALAAVVATLTALLTGRAAILAATVGTIRAAVALTAGVGTSVVTPGTVRATLAAAIRATRAAAVGTTRTTIAIVAAGRTIRATVTVVTLVRAALVAAGPVRATRGAAVGPLALLPVATGSVGPPVIAGRTAILAAVGFAGAPGAVRPLTTARAASRAVGTPVAIAARAASATVGLPLICRRVLVRPPWATGTGIVAEGPPVAPTRAAAATPILPAFVIGGGSVGPLVTAATSGAVRTTCGPVLTALIGSTRTSVATSRIVGRLRWPPLTRSAAVAGPSGATTARVLTTTPTTLVGTALVGAIPNRLPATATTLGGAATRGAIASALIALVAGVIALLGAVAGPAITRAGRPARRIARGAGRAPGTSTRGSVAAVALASVAAARAAASAPRCSKTATTGSVGPPSAAVSGAWVQPVRSPPASAGGRTTVTATIGRLLPVVGRTSLVIHPVSLPVGGRGRKTPPWWSLLTTTGVFYVRRRPTLPQGPPCSTIGAEQLSFRVRNGAGRFPLAMITVTLWSFDRSSRPLLGNRTVDA